MGGEEWARGGRERGACGRHMLGAVEACGDRASRGLVREQGANDWTGGANEWASDLIWIQISKEFKSISNPFKL
jgi:hypothetical protein